MVLRCCVIACFFTVVVAVVAVVLACVASVVGVAAADPAAVETIAVSLLAVLCPLRQ